MINNIINKLFGHFLKPTFIQISRQDTIIRSIDTRINALSDKIFISNMALAEANFQTRAILKQTHKIPINVLFVCHEPAIWNVFDSIYHTMSKDADFSPIVIALPYKHSTLPENQYKNAGMLEFCETRGIKVINGYDNEKNEWLDPRTLSPDYVFFQTPYNLFPPMWSVEQISLMAEVCYIPYGSSVSRGDISIMVHPESFMKYASYYFVENQPKSKAFKDNFEDKFWFSQDRVIVTGYPKLDYFNTTAQFSGNIWKRGLNKNIKRILWTPRFTTSDGTCHFFDYSGFFFSFCLAHPEIDFVFRPHPLCFQNFAKTGEMSVKEQQTLRDEYNKSINMSIDETATYNEAFLTSDFLISDFSSLLIEYLATGKPVIYTHRNNEFSDYALSLSSGMYWVKNTKELTEIILMLISGTDPLRNKREELINQYIFMPKSGAGFTIKNFLKDRYNKK